MNSRQFTPLGRKLAVAILGTSLLALLLALILNLISMLLSHRDDAANRARSLTSLMATSIAVAVDFDDADAAEEDLSSLALIPGITGASVYVNGTKLFASYGKGPQSVTAERPDVLMQLSKLTVVWPIASDSSKCFLIVDVSLDDQWAALSRNFLIAFFIMAGVFGVCIKAAIFFRRKLTDPLLTFTGTVSDISKCKDYSRRVEYDSNDEIGLLVSEFNSMLEKIEQRDIHLQNHQEYLEQKVDERTHELELSKLDLMRNNSMLVEEIRKRTKAEMIREEVERINRHDLKSSLSLIIGYPELLLRNGGLSGIQEKHIRRIRAAGYRMLDMIRNHLDMFKMEKSIYSLSSRPVDLVETVCGLEEEFAPLLGSRGVTLGVELDNCEVVGDEHFVIPGEEQLLRAMLRNLIQNAIEASETGDKVILRMDNYTKKQFSVFNPAPVPKEVRSRIFEKYVTHGKENGTGLGTYFAALIARTHGANISMKTDDGSGTVMTVSFRDDSSQ
ncbi:MAG: HAMP domain-containing protein [Pseudodesulfovibrio sp.]|nr:HAMP domain-containing protein [Pseudodesulfovibrio sp.]